jgi:mannose-6-phosphate isomerase-like protein (cupin superfamily)
MEDFTSICMRPSLRRAQLRIRLTSMSHEEIVMIREGTMEVTIEGKVSVVGPGSVVWAASNDMHGWKNVGTIVAQYFVIALGRPG